MKIMVVGANGRLAKEFLKVTMNTKNTIYSYSKDQLSIFDYFNVKAEFEKVRPDAVLNFAAYVNADKAETDPLCMLSNTVGPQVLAKCCREFDAKLCHISTAFVFDGEKGLNELYTEEDMVNPINQYGKSKLLGEEAIKFEMNNYFIIRTNWLFGSHNDFLVKMIDSAIANKKLSAVDDQYGNFTSIRDLSLFCLDAISTNKFGVYNYANQGATTPYDFILHALKFLGVEAEISKVSYKNFNFVAQRPKNLFLSTDKAIDSGFIVKDWKEALEEFLKEFYNV